MSTALLTDRTRCNVNIQNNKNPTNKSINKGRCQEAVRDISSTNFFQGIIPMTMKRISHPFQQTILCVRVVSWRLWRTPLAVVRKQKRRWIDSKNVPRWVRLRFALCLLYMMWIGVQSTRQAQASPPLLVESSDDETTAAAVVNRPRPRSLSVEIDQADKGRYYWKSFEKWQASVLCTIVENVELSANDMPPSAYDFLSKKCNKLLRENSILQLECDRLKKENHHLKKTTIRMSIEYWFSRHIF